MGSGSPYIFFFFRSFSRIFEIDKYICPFRYFWIKMLKKKIIGVSVSITSPLHRCSRFARNSKRAFSIFTPQLDLERNISGIVDIRFNRTNSEDSGGQCER